MPDCENKECKKLEFQVGSPTVTVEYDKENCRPPERATVNEMTNNIVEGAKIALAIVPCEDGCECDYAEEGRWSEGKIVTRTGTFQQGECTYTVIVKFKRKRREVKGYCEVMEK